MRGFLRNDLNGTLFEGQVDTRIIRGKKLSDHPVSMDIGKICARLCQDRIREKVRRHYFTQLFFSEYHGRYFSFEIQNVRAERRESRDLMQDLEDIRNGIQIVHASDMEKRDSEKKGGDGGRRGSLPPGVWKRNCWRTDMKVWKNSV